MAKNKDDDVVEKVRSARQRIVKRCGGDAHRMRQWVNRLESRHRGRMAGFETTIKARRNR